MTLTLRNRILLTVIPVLVFVLLCGTAGVVVVHHLGGRIDAILRENYDSVIAMERLNEALERIDSSFQFTLSGQESKAREQFQTNWQTYRENLGFEQGNVTVPGEQELVEQLTEWTDRYQRQGEAFYARRAEDPQRHKDYFSVPGLLETFTQIKAVSAQIARLNQENMEQASREAKRTATVSLTGFSLGLAVAVLLAALAGWHTFHAIHRPIRAVTDSARGVSAGDLDQVVRYLSRDALGELAEAFNQMTQRIREERKQLVGTTETLRRELSEREEMEHSLRQLAAIVESSDDAIIGQTLDGSITTWNKGAERIYGFCAATMVGQSHNILVPPEHLTELPAIRELIRRGEHVEHFETVRRRKDGQRIFVSLTVSPVRTGSGELIGVATISRDITQRKRAEEELRLAAAYNRRLLEASLDPLVTIGPDGRITDVNAATEAATGFSRAELLGKDFADYFTDRDRARIGYERVFGEGSVRDFALELRHRDGHVISVLYNAAVYRNEAGKVVGVFAAARDITQRKGAEEALRASEERTRMILDTANDPFITINTHGEILDWNRQAELVFGWSREEAIGRILSETIIPPQHRDAHDRGLRDFLVTGNGPMLNTRTELTALRRDGGEFPVELLAWPIHTGGILTISAFVQDITERKQAEEKVRRLAQLQSAIAELGQRALRTDSTAGLLDEAVGVVARNLDVDLCNVLELLPGGEELLLRAGVGWKEGMVGHATVKTQGTQPGYVIRSGCPVIVEDAARETRFTLLPRMLGEDVVSAMSVVIATPEGPYGALGAHSRRRRTFTQDEVHFLQAVANVLGAAIQRQRAEEQLRRTNRAHRALSSCNQALIRATEETALLEQICRIIVGEAGYRLCWVGYAEPDKARTVRPVAQAGFEEGYLKTVNITWADTERGRGPTGTCIRTGQPSLLKDIASDPRFAPWRAEALKRGYASNLGIPLIADSTTLGALTIYAAEPNAFGEEEVKLLSELAGDLAFGVMNLRSRAERKQAIELQVVHDKEVKIGYDIQQSLLLDPPPVDLPGLQVAALTVPSRQVDGDFYHFYQHENDCLDIMVADVMGKGIPAALLAAATKSHLQTALSHLLEMSRNGALPEPREIVTLAHAEMVQQLIKLESFVTLGYVRFDPNRRSLVMVDCGHTGLMHWHAATGACETLHGKNLAMGMRQGEIYDQIAVPIEPNDLLLLYSDGITEARNHARELFGEKRLHQCVQANSRLEPALLVQAIQQAVFDFGGAEPLRDDLTCVAVKVVERELPRARPEMAIHSDLKELARARAFVRSVCQDGSNAPLDDDGIAQLELAVTEACSNIVKHAYRGRSDQWIHLEAEVFPSRVAIRLHHLGDPLDPAKVAPPRLDGSEESGFGLYLMNHSVDEVRHYRDKRGRNCVALVKTRNVAEGDGHHEHRS